MFSFLSGSFLTFVVAIVGTRLALMFAVFLVLLLVIFLVRVGAIRKPRYFVLNDARELSNGFGLERVALLTDNDQSLRSFGDDDV